jgi:hypothetical protein
MKLVLAACHPYIEEALSARKECTGDPLLDPLLQSRARLAQLGFQLVTRRESDMAYADVAVCVDLDAPLWQTILQLPANIPCLLLAMDSPIRVLWSHNAQTLFNKRWAAVLTWNRSYEAKHVYYYDIPLARTVPAIIPGGSEEKLNKGVSVSIYKEATRGITGKRDHLYSTLAKQGEVDVYGPRWPMRRNAGLCGPTQNPITTMQRYLYALVCENSVYPGYVTAQLADSILAGIPAIYYGDYITAERRFPGSFVRLHNLSVPAFLEARQELWANYQRLQANVVKCRANASEWSKSFFETFLDIVMYLKRGIALPVPPHRPR